MHNSLLLLLLPVKCSKTTVTSPHSSATLIYGVSVDNGHTIGTVRYLCTRLHWTTFCTDTIILPIKLSERLKLLSAQVDTVLKKYTGRQLLQLPMS